MVLSFLLTFLTSGVLSATAGSFLYFYIIFIALIVLNIEILSIFKGISPFGIILLNIIFFTAALILWIKKGRPHILVHLYKEKAKSFLKRILNSFKLDKGLIVLGIGVLFLIAVSFIMCAILPVNEPDALEYHAYRALVWAQKGFIHHFDTTDIRSHVMPINSELIYTWIFSLTKKDFGLGFIEFFSYFAGIAAFWTFFEKFKFSYRKRLWAIFIFSSFAGVIAQISSTQTDLFTGVLLFYSIIFFLDFVDKKDNIKGYFSSLSFAIALGVKSTAFMAGLALIFLFLVYSVWKKSFRDFIKFIVLLFINFVIFSSYNYILNIISYHNPFGSKMSVNMHGFYGGFKAFIANFITYNLQLFDFSGFMWGIYLSPLMFKIQNVLFNLFHIEAGTGVLLKIEGLNSSLVESETGYGVTGILTFLPCAIWSALLFIKNPKNKRAVLYALGIGFYLNLIILSFAVGYMIYSIRFVLTFYTICMPVLALCYFKKNNFYKTVVIIFALYYLFLASTHLAIRPFWRIVSSYKNESSYKTFIEKTRCMQYGYYKCERRGCEIADGFLKHIEEYKTVGFFSDENTMQEIVNIAANKKHVKFDELLFTRIDDYELEKYDYIATPRELQTLNVFNKKDEQKYLDDTLLKGCYLVNNNYNAEFTEVLTKTKEENLEKANGAICKTPYEYIAGKGFVPVNQSNISWEVYGRDDTRYSNIIIWKNIKQNY